MSKGYEPEIKWIYEWSSAEMWIEATQDEFTQEDCVLWKEEEEQEAEEHQHLKGGQS